MAEPESRENGGVNGSTPEATVGSPGEAPARAAGGGGSVARVAGRGGLFVAAGKAYFILIGFVQQVLLKALLGLDGFGALSSALSIAGIAYNPIVSASIQGVSRAVAQAPDAERAAVTRQVLRIHAGLTLPFAGLFFLVAGPIADAAGMPHVKTPLRILSIVLLFYGLYSPLIGVVNGQKRFHWQAGFDAAFATLRTLLLLAGGYAFLRWFGLGVEGATLGFGLASALIFGAALLAIGTGAPGTVEPLTAPHLLLMRRLLVGQFLLNLLLQADLTLLRVFASGAAARAGMPLEAADPLVGAYRATQLFSFLPYQLLLSITFVIFPLLATAHRDGDAAAVTRYVRTGVRIAFIIAGGMVSVTSGLARPLVAAVFGRDTAALAARSLELLALGFGAFALFGILVTILNSLKYERASMRITALAFGLVVVLCTLVVRPAPFGEGLVFRTAASTSLAILLATGAAALMVLRAAGGVVSPVSAARVVLATAVAIVVARWLPDLGLTGTAAFGLVVVKAAVVELVYAATLLASRELGRDDLALVRAVIERRRRS